MANITFSPEQKVLLQMIGHNLFDMPFSPSRETDWRAVYRESRAQAVGILAFQHYRELPMDEDLAADINKFIKASTWRNVQCFQYHTYLHKLMTENGISYCVVKGAASASYYPDPLLRAMGDVDFYVHPEDIDRALAVFEAEGFTRDQVNHPCHIAMKNGKKHFEMHFKPVAYHNGPVGEKLEAYWCNIRETAVTSETELATYIGPSTFHHGFILLTHLQHHLFYEGVGLRHLCDWAVFANAFTSEEFVAVFETELKRIGLFRLAQLLSLCAVKHMGMPHKDWMGDDYETADELLEDILSGGNFGRKDKQRSYEGMFIADRDTGDMSRGRLIQIFSSLNNIVDSHWRAAKKCPVLYPIGWAYFSLRYLIRVLLGKRKMNLVDTYQKSGQRRKKYEKLRVFQPEE